VERRSYAGFMSPIREQLVGISVSIVLVFMLTSGFALYSLLYLSVAWSVAAICVQAVGVLAVAMIGYEHGRKMAGVVHGPDALHYFLAINLLVAFIASAVALYVVLERSKVL